MPQAFTGRGRKKRTRFGVRFADTLSRWVITVGGIGTIVALFLIFAELGREVAPLFTSGEVSDAIKQPHDWGDEQAFLGMRVDEYRTMAWMLYPSGRLQVVRLDNGEVIETRQLVEGPTITSFSDNVSQGDVALGFADGTVRLGHIAFETQFMEVDGVPAELAELSEGDVATLDDGVVQRTPQGQFRRQHVVAELQEPFQLAAEPVRLLDHLSPPPFDSGLGDRVHRVAALTGEQQGHYAVITARKNMLTRKVQLDTEKYPLELAEEELSGRLFRVLLSGRGDNIFLVSEGGTLLRFDVRRPPKLEVVERLNLLEPDASRLTVCNFILMRETLLCGDDQGRLSAWFRTRRQEQELGDGFHMSKVRELAKSDSPALSIGASARSRMVAVGYADGTLRVFQVTTGLLVAEQKIEQGQEILAASIAPKDNGLLAATSGGLWSADFDPAHPEVTVASLFTPVWYEGYSEPKHIWQSSFATQGPEMKLGLRPLVFGTIKATFYTMLFGAPLALLAAIYTSEFMSPRSRATVKPMIEMMASLPSVVLGFLAALVFAPIVERCVPAVLASFFAVPFCFLVASHLWQLMSQTKQVRMARFRLAFMIAVFPCGLALAWVMGPVVEQWFFAGDVKRWLDGQVGSGVGAWLLLWLPMSSVFVTILVSTVLNPWLRTRADRWTRGQFALLSLGKFFVGAAAALALALGVSWALNAAGWDPRGTFVDTYVQRNALVVGFVMGFAVVPIIYTLADDALTTVPRHLRSASLGCGATQWQTTVRIVIPTAMSGLFSAMMIGLGRAVGETMIVLMAGGNTPVMQWNIFDGFRTLSANIAVELPEAVKDSTHYRTLFLAALTLLVLTFFINTLAEVVRLRFRRRAYQL